MKMKTINEIWEHQSMLRYQRVLKRRSKRLTCKLILREKLCFFKDFKRIFKKISDSGASSVEQITYIQNAKK